MINPVGLALLFCFVVAGLVVCAGLILLAFQSTKAVSRFAVASIFCAASSIALAVSRYSRQSIDCTSNASISISTDGGCETLNWPVVAVCGVLLMAATTCLRIALRQRTEFHSTRRSTSTV